MEKKLSFSPSNIPHVKITICIDFMKMKKTRTSEVSKHVREKTDVFQNTKFCSRMEIVIFTLKQSFSASFKKGPYKTLLFWISRPKSFPVLSYGGAYVDLPFYNVLWPYKCSRAKKNLKKTVFEGTPFKTWKLNCQFSVY